MNQYQQHNIKLWEEKDPGTFGYSYGNCLGFKCSICGNECPPGRIKDYDRNNIRILTCYNCSRQISAHEITFGSGYRKIMDVVKDKKPIMEKYSTCCNVPAGITNNTPDGSYARLCPKCKQFCNTYEKEYKKI